MKLGRLVAVLPMVLTLVAFVLSMLALFAGRKQGFMEDYAVVRLNASRIGQTLLDKVPGKSNSGGDEKQGGILGNIQGLLGGDAKDKINQISGQIVDKVTKQIGIKEWYSLHIMDSCEGYYTPNGTFPNAGLNVTNCTVSGPGNRFNLSKILDNELNAGPVKLNLASINFPSTLQDKIDTLNQAILALFVVYAVGAGLGGVAFLGGVAAVWRPDLGRIALLNAAACSLGVLFLFIGSMIVTVAAYEAVKAINKVGESIGLTAHRGTRFIVLSWVATGFMGIVAVFWVAHFWVLRQRKNVGLVEKAAKKAGGSS